VKLAFSLYERSICSCGHSALLSHGFEGHDEYRTETVTCHACAEIAREKADLSPGQRRYAVDLHDDPHDDDLIDDEEAGDDDE
jgi:hypothetical protein